MLIKKKIFGDKYNLHGFEYYNGGIFYIGDISDYPSDGSSLIDNFDWRERHRANDPESPYYNGFHGWNTSIKDQEDLCENTCFVYGTIAALEAPTNLYFDESDNIHINPDLSEQYALSCDGNNNGCENGGHTNKIHDLIYNEGVMDEICCENQQNGNSPEISCNDIIVCNSPEYRIQSSGDMEHGATFDEIKENLIKYGPTSASTI